MLNIGEKVASKADTSVQCGRVEMVLATSTGLPTVQTAVINIVTDPTPARI